MSPRTTFLSRLVGLYAILVSVAMVIHKQTTIDMVTELVNNPVALFAAGVLAVGLGLAMVLSHNVWSGGALPVVVTLSSWAALVKGLMFLFLSPQTASAFFLGELHYEQFFYWYAAYSFLLGAYLIYAGSRSTAS